MNEPRANIQRGRAAMGTWFEARLLGDDPEHLAAVAEAVLDEVQRIERLLSRFDPGSEIARINRDAGERAVLVDREVLAILLACRAAWERTDGYFDVTAPNALRQQSSEAATFAAVAIDPEARTVQFTRPGVALDLGGIGKGYALDRGAEILAVHGVGSALVHGGTSSILARGLDADGRPWSVAVRDPRAALDQAHALFRLSLCDQSLSCSASFGPGQEHSDLIDPHRRAPLEEPTACLVIAGAAADAEVLSTALLCMGRQEAATHAARQADKEQVHACWIADRHSLSSWEWLTLAPLPPAN
jgi:thiamine biosynthesis lipoprotein